jgi:hypothetical protein
VDEGGIETIGSANSHPGDGKEVTSASDAETSASAAPAPGGGGGGEGRMTIEEEEDDDAAGEEEEEEMSRPLSSYEERGRGLEEEVGQGLERSERCQRSGRESGSGCREFKGRRGVEDEDLAVEGEDYYEMYVPPSSD